MKKKPETRGGVRPGVGRPKKPETCVITFRVPKTKKTEAQAVCHNALLMAEVYDVRKPFSKPSN